VSALPQALPLALTAAFYPPALLMVVLLLAGTHPRRLVLAYYIGAAILTVGAGLIALALLKQAGVTSQSSRSASGGLDILLGVVLLGLAAWAWRRRAQGPAASPSRAAGSSRWLAEWSRRATTSQRWAFVLGLAMFLPSPLYLLAVKYVADSGASTSSNVLAVLICAVGVMVFVEIPLAALVVAPGSVATGIERFHGWLKRNGWTLAAVIAAAAAIDAIVTGISALS
jgi:Sap, sulfolipid-1-addressing protein